MSNVYVEKESGMRNERLLLSPRGEAMVSRGGKFSGAQYLRMQVKGTLRCVIAVLLDKGRELNVDLLLLTSLYHQALHRREMKSHADPQVPAEGSFLRQSKLSLQILRRLETITSRRTVW